MEKVIDLYAYLAYEIGNSYGEFPGGFVLEMNEATCKTIKNATPPSFWVVEPPSSCTGYIGVYEGSPIVINNELKNLQIKIKEEIKKFRVEE